MTALWPRGQRRGNLDNAKAPGDGFDGELGFYFKSTAKDWQGLHKLAIKSAIAREDVGELYPKNRVQNTKYQPVGPTIQLLEFAFRFRMQPRAYDHIGLVIQNRLDQASHVARGVSAVAIDH